MTSGEGRNLWVGGGLRRVTVNSVVRGKTEYPPVGTKTINGMEESDKRVPLQRKTTVEEAYVERGSV